MCLAILLLGENFESGSSTSKGGSSGFLSTASFSLPIVSWVSILNFSEVDFLNSCSKVSIAARSLHFSHLKSSMYSVLNIPSKQLFKVVLLTCGTLSVNVQNVDVVGLGLNLHVRHSICDSYLPSIGNPSSSS